MTLLRKIAALICTMIDRDDVTKKEAGKPRGWLLRSIHTLRVRIWDSSIVVLYKDRVFGIFFNLMINDQYIDPPNTSFRAI